MEPFGLMLRGLPSVISTVCKRSVFFSSVHVLRRVYCGTSFLFCFCEFLILLRQNIVCNMSLRLQPLAVFPRRAKRLSLSISELINLCVTGKKQSQADQPLGLKKVPRRCCNLSFLVPQWLFWFKLNSHSKSQIAYTMQQCP